MKYWNNIATGSSIEFNEETGDYNVAVNSYITHKQVKINRNNKDDLNFGQMCYIEDVFFYGFGNQKTDEIINVVFSGCW